MPEGAKRPARPRGGGWTLRSEPAEKVLANARKAFFVMVGVLVVLWAVQIANWADGYQFSATYGIQSRDLSGLPHILTAPFLHFSWSHIEGNSGPLFIFGFLAAYRGIGKFAMVTVIVVLTSGLAAWFFQAPQAVGAGASGAVFGYFGYIMVRGLFDRHAIDIIIGAVMALCFAYQFTVLLPHRGIGWQAHIGGLAGGIISGWLLRERRGARAASAARPAGTAAGTSMVKAGPGAIEGPASASTGRRPRKDDDQPAGGKGFTVDPSNPRAELYKQLDDMGL